MTDEERQLEQECPRKILGVLHLRGQYSHYSCTRRPGKVLCISRDGEIPAGCTPTCAQAMAWGMSNAQRATG